MRRIYHPWTEWECYRAGMFDGETDLPANQAKLAYADFLRDIPRFRAAIQRVMNEWPKSCEHFLTNENINRVAWLGQAAMCMDTGLSRKHRGGFMLMDQQECRRANATAAEALTQWINARKNRTVHHRVEMSGLFG